MQKTNNADWLELCKYIHKEILRYDDTMKFPRLLALRLRGLEKGTFIANKYHKPLARYDYKTILITAKLCKNNIINYIDKHTSTIKSEQHRINIIMKFLESEINDVFLRIQNVKKQQAKIQNVTIPTNVGAKYTSKTTKENGKLDELW